MTREIKFRAWALNKMIKWEDIALVFEFNTKFGRDYFNLKEYFDYIEAQEFILMQYIGQKDVNGTEMYEGDICRQHWNGHEIVAPMIWNPAKCQFGLDAEVDFDPGTSELKIKIPANTAPEVIGNIYENPELIK